ncbi:hypothetical protein RchiOBHm_Chr2g0112971 [Rosa chinensis]|uniref:Uncharacterized protein n=1 Tax=Rosa chinensis TaxID=74649 RepID=A0A2P6RQE9_ROSCH|nr:hypothetical protein RchiOBHm_Chr2g0112971 [Rosa chinensis]
MDIVIPILFFSHFDFDSDSNSNLLRLIPIDSESDSDLLLCSCCLLHCSYYCFSYIYFKD